MRIDGSAVRAGMVIEYEGKLCLVTKHEIRTPGNLRSFNQVEIKDVKTGTKKSMRLNSNDMIERAHLDSREYQFLYEDSDEINVMDPKSYEQITISKSLIGDSIKFLKDGMMIKVELYE